MRGGAEAQRRLRDCGRCERPRPGLPDGRGYYAADPMLSCTLRKRSRLLLR
jgi:hypothetical protein